MDEQEIIRLAMQALGRKRSERKTAACRRNAKRKRPGGRKRKQQRAYERLANSMPVSAEV